MYATPGQSVNAFGQTANPGLKQTAFTPDDNRYNAGFPRLRTGLSNPLPVTPRPQEGGYSCWSTCAEMIMEFLGRRVRQCEQASAHGDLSVWCCVNNELRRECDAPNYPDFERWGFNSTNQFPNALTWDQVVTEIDEGRPFAFARSRNIPGNTISHMLVAIGYRETAGQPQTREILCLNPRAFTTTDEETVAYSDYTGFPAVVTGNGIIPGSTYTHELVYYEIHRAPPAPENQ